MAAIYATEQSGDREAMVVGGDAEALVGTGFWVLDGKWRDLLGRILKRHGSKMLPPLWSVLGFGF